MFAPLYVLHVQFLDSSIYYGEDATQRNQFLFKVVAKFVILQRSYLLVIYLYFEPNEITILFATKNASLFIFSLGIKIFK